MRGKSEREDQLERWLLEYQRGDVSAFQSLYDAISGSLYSFFVAMCLDPTPNFDDRARREILSDLERGSPLKPLATSRVVALLGLATVVYGLCLAILRERIPGSGLSVRGVVLSVMGLIGLRALLPLTIQHEHPDPVVGGSSLRLIQICGGMIAGLSIPLLVLRFLALRRGFLTRRGVPALLLGFAAVAGGEAAWRLFCPYSDLEHVGISHSAPLLIAIPIAYGIASWLIRQRERST